MSPRYTEVREYYSGNQNGTPSFREKDRESPRSGQSEAAVSVDEKSSELKSQMASIGRGSEASRPSGPIGLSGYVHPISE